MDRTLFSKVAKLAHKLTKEYRNRYGKDSCDYRTQQAIFFKIVYAYFKNKKDNVTNIINKAGRKLQYHVMVVSNNIKYQVVEYGKHVSNDIKSWKSIWNLIDKGIDVSKIIS